MFTIGVLLSLVLMLAPVIAHLCGYRKPTTGSNPEAQLDRQALIFFRRENWKNSQ